MPKALVILADGFEELEAAAPITVLRRAGVEVTVAGLHDKPVRGSRGVTFVPDAALDWVADQPFDLVVLPGGMPGTLNLRNSPLVSHVLRVAQQRGVLIAAICAAPTVLAAMGLLQGRRATAHASVRAELSLACTELVVDSPVVTDGKFVTSAGAGTAVEFALELVRLLLGDAKAREVARAMMIDGR
ncbi:MAG: DJ-1/PfpI family protein [Myxococcales bacterium]|nr:DJ-1/PfpI family protein [Myxococcales bacterium]